MSEQILLSALTAVGGYEIGTGRTVPSIAAVLGLISIVVAGWTLVRRASVASRRGGVVALVLGSVAVVVGGVHAVNAAGGLGTGNGLAGAVVAVVAGLVGAVLAGLVLVRVHRSGRAA